MGRKGEKKEIEVLARAVCVKDGKLLLCQTKDRDNTYLPGGHVEVGEKAEDSLERELWEELGLQSSIGRFMGDVEHDYVQDEVQHFELNLVFEVTIEDLSATDDPSSEEDYIEFLWVDLSDIKQSLLEPRPLRKLIPLWLESPGPEPAVSER
jgi:8-oxo-dGTP diphosphatase